MSHREIVKKFWNTAVAHYDEHMKKTAHYKAQKELYSALEDYFVSPILDLGSGPGFLAGVLLDKNKEVTLNDFSPKIFELFSKKFQKSKKASFSNQDAHCIETTAKFKTIFCSNLFYYLDDRNIAIKNWKGLLEENGKIILFEENPFLISKNGDDFSQEDKELEKIIDPVSPEKIKTILRNNGMALIEEKKVSIDPHHDLYGYVFAKTENLG